VANTMIFTRDQEEVTAEVKTFTTDAGRNLIVLSVECDHDRVNLHISRENLVRLRNAIDMFLIERI